MKSKTSCQKVSGKQVPKVMETKLNAHFSSLKGRGAE